MKTTDRDTRRKAADGYRVGPHTVRISDELDDREWDDFLERVPGADYAQSACWGRAHGVLGWACTRVVVSENGVVVAGGQLVTRALPVGGRIALVRKGPVALGDDPQLVRVVLEGIRDAGKARSVQVLIAQPPRGSDGLAAELARFGLHPTRIRILGQQQTSALRVHLEDDVDVLLGRMSRKFRQHLRSADRSGIVVRRGGVDDMSTFHRLKDAHSRRLGYDRRDEAYYAELWRSFDQRGCIEIFVAEHLGEPVSALLVIRFGDTCYHIERPWSGEHGHLQPNLVLEWEVMKWAKSQGCRFADFGMTERGVAVEVLAGRRNAVDARYGASIFKLRLGAELVTDPPFYEFVFNPALRFAYRAMPETLLRSKWLNSLASRFTATGS